MIEEQRQRLTKTALEVLQMVVLDILQEAESNEEGGLSNVQIRDRASGLESGPAWKIFDGLLDILEEQNMAVNDTPGGGPGHWRPS